MIGQVEMEGSMRNFEDIFTIMTQVWKYPHKIKCYELGPF